MKDKGMRKHAVMLANESERLSVEYEEGMSNKIKFLHPVNDCCYFCKHGNFKYYASGGSKAKEVTVCGLHDFLFFEDPMLVKCGDYEKADNDRSDRYIGR